MQEKQSRRGATESLVFTDAESDTVLFALKSIRLFFWARGMRAHPRRLDNESLAAGLEAVDGLTQKIEAGQREVMGVASGEGMDAEMVVSALRHVIYMGEMGPLAHPDLPDAELYTDELSRDKVTEHAPLALSMLQNAEVLRDGPA